MLFFDFSELSQIQSAINITDVYTEPGDTSYGLEDEPHVTLLYGLHEEVGVASIRQVVENMEFGPCNLQKLSIFENTYYDVLKYEVSGFGLHECNKELKSYPHTTGFPVYNPHLTVGYLKPGLGKKYVDLLHQKGYSDYWLEPSHAVYSTPSGEKYKINIQNMR